MNKRFDPWAELENQKPPLTLANPAKPANPPEVVTSGLAVPEEWEAGFKRLLSAPAPRLIGVERWRVVVQDVGYFMPLWAAAALGLGWSAISLFGVDPRKPDARVDNAGLCWLLNGATVAAVMADRIAIRGQRDRIKHFYRHPDRTDAVLLWEFPGAAADSQSAQTNTNALS